MSTGNKKESIIYFKGVYRQLKTHIRVYFDVKMKAETSPYCKNITKTRVQVKMTTTKK